jgi:hypothetical protein
VVDVPTPTDWKVYVSVLSGPNGRLTQMVSEETPPSPFTPKSSRNEGNYFCISVKMLALHYVFKLKSVEKTLRQINPFSIHKALDAITREVKNISRLKNGMLLVEVFSDKQAETPLKTQLLRSYSVQRSSIITSPSATPRSY